MHNLVHLLDKFPHRKVQWLGLALLLVGLPFSRILMSIGQLVLVGNWLLEGFAHRKMGQQLRLFWQDRAALALFGVFLVHVIGLAYTQDMEYGLKDLRVKLPLLALPLVLASSPKLQRKQLEQLIGLFLLSLVFCSGFSFGKYLGWFGPVPEDLRQLSPFISHIRLSLMATLGFFLAGYFAFTSRPNWQRIAAVLFMFGMLSFLFLLQVISAALAWGITAFLVLLYTAWRQRRLGLRITLIALLVGLPTIFGVWVYHSVSNFYSADPIDVALLDTHTAGGHTYGHYTDQTQLENGNYVWLYIAWTELEIGWQKRSDITLEGIDGKGNVLSGTLIRFLTSKNLRKDLEGVAQLSDSEVQAIESGIANVRFMDHSNSLSNRMYRIVWEFDSYLSGQNPQGNSVTMRLEFWQTGWQIVKQHSWFGVGTGDVQDAFDAQYSLSNSQLSDRYRLRAHNQYLSLLVAFGWVGLVYTLLAWGTPFFFRPSRLNYFFLVSLCIALLSMISEDTLETQAGATFVVLPYCLFLFGWDTES